MWIQEKRVASLLVPLALAMLLTLTACSGYPFLLPPTAPPTWPPGASPRPAVTYPAQSVTTKNSTTSSEGWFFRPVVDIELTALGYYDDGQDGLLHAHRSAIFDGATKRALVETTIRPQSQRDGLFRWEPVGPVVLKAGHEYVMVSSRGEPFDPEVLNPENASLAPELLYLCCRETQENGPTWGCPDRRVENVLLSGNFKFKPLSVASATPQAGPMAERDSYCRAGASRPSRVRRPVHARLGRSCFFTAAPPRRFGL
jgi:hypothetical protein